MGISACCDHIIDLIEAASLKRNPAGGLQALKRGDGGVRPTLDSMPNADRRFVVVEGLSEDDGEAGISDRRRRIELTVRVRYDMARAADTIGRRINEDLAALSDALTNPNLWDASSGLDDIARPSGVLPLTEITAPGATEPHAVVVEVPVLLRYYEG